MILIPTYPHRIQWHNCTWSSHTFETRTWPLICKHCCCKFWLKGERLWGFCHPAGWASPLAFWGEYFPFLNWKLLLSLGGSSWFGWVCLGFLGMPQGRVDLWSLKTWKIQFREQEKHKVHLILTPLHNLCTFPNKPCLSLPGAQHEVCNCGQCFLMSRAELHSFSHICYLIGWAIWN